MEIIKLAATPRALSGKGPSRQLRAKGLIPAVAYGKKLASTSLAVAPKGVSQVLHAPHGRNTVVALDVEGGEAITVLLRDYAVHPISRNILHADFYQVKLDEPVDVEVPFRCVGKCKGVAAGGILQVVFRKLPVRCLPEKTPIAIEADISDVDLNESFKASQLKLPEGVVVTLPPEQTVANVVAPERAPEEEKAAAAAAAGKAPAAGKAAAGKAAAPAAGKAAAPAAAKPAAKK
jgi:large subunit ribosomal protein L25